MGSLRKRNEAKNVHLFGDRLACSHQLLLHATSVAMYEIAIDAYVCRYSMRTNPTMRTEYAGNRC